MIYVPVLPMTKRFSNTLNLVRTFTKLFQKGKHVIADAGCALTEFTIIPFPITETMPADERLFNYFHSRTRIAVERAIGMLKNRFRILKVPLNKMPNRVTGSSATTQMAKVIRACFVLHNILCSLGDGDVDEDNPGSGSVDDDDFDQPEIQQVAGRERCLTVRENIKNFLSTTRS